MGVLDLYLGVLDLYLGVGHREFDPTIVKDASVAGLNVLEAGDEIRVDRGLDVDLKIKK